MTTRRDWMTSQGDRIDRTHLQALLDEGFGPEGATKDARFGLQLAVAAHHRGELVFERYGETAGPDTPLISWSMAKSITHALVGLLVHDGLLDPSAPADVPAWADDNRSAITLQQLLTMTSGLEFVEDYVDDEESDVIEMLFGSGRDDVAGFAAGSPLVHEPGTVFSYSSGTTNIVSAICSRAIDRGGGGAGARAVLEHLQRRLFDPLGMAQTTARCDASGTFIGSSFVYAPARDYLRFGQLYLDDGLVGGQRLLPAGWVDHARRPVAVEVDERHWYGAHWWLWDRHTAADADHAGFDCADIDGFAAHGYEGQFTVVVPARDLVITRLGKTPVEQQPEVRSWLADIIRCFPVS